MSKFVKVTPRILYTLVILLHSLIGYWHHDVRLSVMACIVTLMVSVQG